MPPDLRQEARLRRDAPQPFPHQARWPAVGLDGCLQVPVRPLSPAESLDAPQRAIVQADSRRPKAVAPGLDEQQDDSRPKAQRGSWMGCGSWQDLATVVPRRPHEPHLRLRRLVPRLLRLHVRLHPRVQKRLLPRGARQCTSQREELWIFSRCHLL